MSVVFTLETELKDERRFICRRCSKETDHRIVVRYRETGSEDDGGGYSYEWGCDNEVIQCLGCKDVSFRVESTNSEDYDHDHDGSMYWIIQEKFYPARRAGLKVLDVYLLPMRVQDVYRETILAIENEQNVLAGIGIRALIESICKDLDIKGGNLEAKIDSLNEKGVATRGNIEALHQLRILGNEAAHEVKKHSAAKLTLALEIIEHMLDGTYILPEKVKNTFENRKLRVPGIADGA